MSLATEGGRESTVSATSGSPVAEVLAVLSLVVSSAGLSVSLAALLFAGTIADGLPRGTTVFLVGSGLTTAITGIRGSIPAAISPTQDGPVIVLIAVVANLVASGENVTAVDVIVTVGLASLLTGLIFIIIGRFSLGGVVRFIPAVVVNAFIAGTGWLLFRGGLQVMLGGQPGDVDLLQMFSGQHLKFWIPGLLVGVATYLLSSRPNVPNGAAAGLIVVATVAFYGVVLAVSSIGAVEEGGWLIGPFEAPPVLSIITPSEIASTPWGVLARQLPALGAVSAVSALAILLNLSALEIVTRQRADVDRDLVRLGLANAAQSIIGSSPAYHGMGFTSMAHRMGATSKRVPIAVGLAVAAFGVLGVSAIGYAPRLIVGGLLTAVGLGLMAEWLDEMRHSVGATGWIISLVIIGCIATVGVLEGILLGVIIACGVFIIRYSRVDPVRRWRTGTTARSLVDRTTEELDALVSVGDRTRVAEMQGFLFFGSMTGLVERLRLLPEDDVDNLILDFHHVTGIDGSAMRLLQRVVGDLGSRGVTVMVADPPEVISAGLSKAQQKTDNDSAVEMHDSLDAALAAVEEQVLAQATSAIEADRQPLSAELLEPFERRTVEAGTALMTAGDDADTLIYLLSGSVSVYAENGDDQARSTFRLRKVSAPGWLGEIGFLQSSVRSANVVADTEVDLASIERSQFEDLRSSRPDVVIALLDSIANEQARRVQTLSSALTQASG